MQWNVITGVICRSPAAGQDNVTQNKQGWNPRVKTQIRNHEAVKEEG